MVNLNQSPIVVYEDNELLIFSKPQGLPSGLGKRINFCEIVFNFRPELAKIKGFQAGEGGLLNRLDNETGGLILFAKTEQGFSYYSQQSKAEKIEKIYAAIVDGIPKEKYGIIQLPLAHSKKANYKMVVAQKPFKWRGRPQLATTFWWLENSGRQFSLLRLLIKKGIRHQLRLHLSHQGLPIVGDKIYNQKQSRWLTDFQLLYCYGIKFIDFHGKLQEIFISNPLLEKYFILEKISPNAKI